MLAEFSVKYTVGVGQMIIASQQDDVLVTHALGSCLGITAHDPHSRVGGLLHAMLPESSINPEKARSNPYMFVDSGLAEFVKALCSHGASRGRLVLKVAGGASIHNSGVVDGGQDRFAIGKRNCIMLRKILWQAGMLLRGQDLGGCDPRTMYLDIGTGRVWLKIAGQEKEL